MKLGYSQKLIESCQKAVKKKAGLEITKKEAEEFLDQLAALGKLAVESFNADRKGKDKKDKK
ncbi:MAG: hypothetical protein U5L10_02160 [Candidatus Moranbacteria bacterium]|nr:hypothetical protein [Candidatus Moranbacteria bacterium]